MKKLLYLFLFCSRIAFSQNIISKEEASKIQPPKASESSKYQFLAKAKYYGDSVVLRWSANDAVLWQVANSIGYTIERYEYNKGNLINKQVLVQKLKPWSLDEWKAKCKRTDTTAAMAAQLLYGISKDPKNPQGSGNLDAVLNQRYDSENRFFMVNMLAAWHPFHSKGLALRFSDQGVQKNKTYLYKIYTPIPQTILKADTAFVVVNTNVKEPLENMIAIYDEPRDRNVKLKWSKLLGDTQFIGYYYERSDDNGITFKRINKKPFIKLANGETESDEFISFIDSLPKNYYKYIYRVAGINYFGEISKYSPNIEVIGKDLTPPTQVFDVRAENLNSNKVTISWKKTTIEPDMVGYVIGRSQSISGPFQPLQNQFLPINATSFTDQNAEAFGTNYYVVSAVDTAGNAAISLPAYVVMKDEAPPAMPTGLKGNIDSTGIVKITWEKNTEPDLLGYMVYTANAPDHVFTPLTTGFLADEFFADSTTLRTLTKYKYYRVVAFDKSRKASPYSEILKLKRPDKIPPVSPVFNNFTVADSSATIFWIRSSSDDVAQQILYRKEEGKDTDWQVITKLDENQSNFTDHSVLPKHWYSYSLVAIDDAQLPSEKSVPIRLRPYDSAFEKGVDNLKIDLTDSKTVKISWHFLSNPKARIIIYRKKDSETLVPFENLPSSQNYYIDKLTSAGKYQYVIKVNYNDGRKSTLKYTDVIQITF